MSTTTTPDQGHLDPRHTFLTTAQVFTRFGWGRTYGYDMLKTPDFPRPIGGRYRLDTLMHWENRVLAGELPGRPAARAAQGRAGESADAPAQAPQSVPTEPQQKAVTPSDPGAADQDRPGTAAELAAAPGTQESDDVEAPRRRRTRGRRTS